MAKQQKRYWVYVHDEGGDLDQTLVETNDLEEAVEEASHWIWAHLTKAARLGYTVRVVDNELNEGTTIWKAGPVKSVEEA